MNSSDGGHYVVEGEASRRPYALQSQHEGANLSNWAFRPQDVCF